MPDDIERRNIRKSLDATRAMVEDNLKRLEDNLARPEMTRDAAEGGRSERTAVLESAVARLRAKLDSLPVIEQAKGILMAQSGCQPDEAFDMLRRASQRTNVKVRDLAAEIVNRAAGADGARRAGNPPAATDHRPTGEPAEPAG